MRLEFFDRALQMELFDKPFVAGLAHHCASLRAMHSRWIEIIDQLRSWSALIPVTGLASIVG